MDHSPSGANQTSLTVKKEKTMRFEKDIRIFFYGKEKATTNTWNDDEVASAPKPSKNVDDTVVLSD